MSDFERDSGVTNLLMMAGDEATRFVSPDGVGAVVSTVRHRRRTRAAAITALALVLLGAPVTAVALAGVHHNTAPPGGGPTSAPPSASDSPTPQPSASSQPAAPDGRISLDELRRATITVPAWRSGDDGCPSGKVTLSGGKAGSGMMALTGEPAYVDLDHDGAQETVVLISCSPQWSDYKVIALDRDASGAIVTLGQVVASGTGKIGVDIMTIWGVAAGDNGQVRVDVGEYRPCCEEAQASQHQWRTYGWNGTAFTQTGGPTAFGPNPLVTDLVVTAAPLAMVKQPDGSYQGTLHVTMHNAAKFTTPGQLQLRVDSPDGWSAQQVAGSVCRPDENRTCALPALAAGASRTFDVKVTVPAGGSQGQCVLYPLAHATDSYGYYPDRKATAGTTVQVTWS
jgi:hypothetical protein